MTTKTITSTDGVRIAYEDYGLCDAVLVFVHGWSCNRSHWRRQVDAFSDRYRVLDLDLAGHGESGKNRDSWTRRAFARDVVSVLDEEGVERAVLVGHSMGGGVILEAAKLLGERCVGLVGADTFGNLKGDPSSGPMADRSAAMEADYHGTAAAWIASMFVEDSPDELVAEITRGMLSMDPTIGLGALQKTIMAGPTFELASQLQVPKYTINAPGSPIDVETANEAGIKVMRVSRGGHFVMLEEPEEFNRLLNEALSDIYQHQGT